MKVNVANYLIIDNPANGGFGSIFRAIQEKDITKRIVIMKTIKKKFAKDKSFKNNFLSEIKTSFPLTHPNIAQIYDYGESDGILYYILEYVEGVTVRNLIRKSIENKADLKIPHIVYIIIEACKGLHFAHNFKDQLTGEKYKIVHRDITPHNIMISYTGDIKIIDFGIAKAKTNLETTTVGVYKGKPAYMAPEYIRSGIYDHRFDQFSLGIIFWEMLTRKKLFTGKNYIEIIKSIDKCEIPLPRFHNDNIDHELQEIILKMLHKNPRKRFSNLSTVIQELNKHLYKTYPDFSPSDFSGFIKKIYSSQIRWEETRLRRLINDALNKVAIKDELLNSAKKIRKSS